MRNFINMLEAIEKGCPPATQSIKLNLENRQKAIDEYLNLRIKVRKFNPQSKQAEHFDSAPRIFSNPAKKANLHVWITFVFLSHSGTHEIMDYIFSLSVPWFCLCF